MAGIVALLLLACGSARMTPGVTGVYHDDAIYVATSRALAEGAGYRLINLPGAPRQTKYPPLYPLLLAPVWWLRADLRTTITLMQALTLATAALWAGSACLFLIRFRLCSRRAALAIGLLTATSLDASYFGSLIVSETPFAAALVLSLWQLQPDRARTPKRPWGTAADGLALAAPFLVRSLGAAVPVAALLLRRRALTPALAVAGLIVAPWLAWSNGAAGTFESGPAGYYQDYVGAWLTLLRSDGLGILRGNAIALPTVLGKTGIGSVAAALGDTPLVLLLPLAGCLVLISLVREARHGCLQAWVIGLYLSVLVVWPWPPARFVVPLTPFVILYLYRAIDKPSRRWLGAASRATVLWGLVGGTLALNVWDVGRAAVVARQQGYPRLESVSWDGFTDLFKWIRRHSEPSDVLASGLDTMLYVYTERAAVRAFPHRPDALFYGSPRPPVGSVDELLALLDHQHVRLLVETPMPGFAEAAPFRQLVEDAKRQAPDRLELVYRGEDPRFAVYRVQSSSSRDASRGPGAQ